MANITIRNIEDDVKKRLRVRAANNNRSMEEEARIILRDAVSKPSDSRNIVDIFISQFGPENGVDLELPLRIPMREPPKFD